MNAALACGDAKASVEFDIPASVMTINDGTELLRELSGVLLKDGKITLDAKNGFIRGTQQAFGDYRVSLNMDRRQLALSWVSRRLPQGSRQSVTRGGVASHQARRKHHTANAKSLL